MLGYIDVGHERVHIAGVENKGIKVNYYEIRSTKIAFTEVTSSQTC